MRSVPSRGSRFDHIYDRNGAGQETSLRASPSPSRDTPSRPEEVRLQRQFNKTSSPAAVCLPQGKRNKLTAHGLRESLDAELRLGPDDVGDPFAVLTPSLASMDFSL
jgi:hypothetical protein